MPAYLKVCNEQGVELFNTKTNKVFSFITEGTITLIANVLGKNTVRLTNSEIVGGRTFIRVRITNYGDVSQYEFNSPTTFMIESTGYVDIITFFNTAPPTNGVNLIYEYSLYRF